MKRHTEPPASGKATPWRRVARFIYPDGCEDRKERIFADGTIEKTFVLHRRDPQTDKYIPGLNGRTLSLYEQHEISGARFVVMTEGAGKARDLRAAFHERGIKDVGVTTIAGGCAARLSDTQLEALRGKDVIYLADSDEEGRCAATARCDALLLHDFERFVKLVDLYPQAKPGDVDYKKDIADWLGEGHTVDELLDIFEKAKTFAEDGARLLNDIVVAYCRYLAWPRHYAHFMALYVMHTHAFKAARLTTYPFFRSAESESGKSLALTITQNLAHNGEMLVTVSAPAIFRMIDASDQPPSLCIDEIDTIFGQHATERNEELRALINSGFRHGATVPRCVPPTFKEVRRFPTFCPKAFAGLVCRMSDTTLSRCTILDMQRMRPEDFDGVEPFYEADALPLLDALRERLSRWANQNVEALKAIRPAKIPALRYAARMHDMWSPLLAIAERVSPRWLRRAQSTMVLFARKRAASQDLSLGVRALVRVRKTFNELELDRLASADLARAFRDSQEPEWGSRFGHDFDERDLARILRPYRIQPRTIRFGEQHTAKGYYRSQFEDSWARYLPSIAPRRQDPSQPSQPSQT